MELRHLRHFLAVAEELHMGRAALRLAMAQPPLSQSIGRLEKELGVKLFERANRRLTLTRAGAAFVEEARASVLHADAALHVARAAHDGEAGEIRIGFVSAALYEHLPHLLSRVRETYPDIRPKLIEVSTNEQIAALSRNEIDIGFVHPPLGTDERLDVHGYPAEDLIAVLPDDRHTHGVTLTDIARHGLIMFPAAQGPALHPRIMDTFTRAGVEVRIVQEATRALTMLSLVAAGFGAALLPRSTQRLVFQGVRYAAIADVSLPAWPLAVIAKRRPRPAIVDSVWKLLEARSDVS
ncbi:MAG: LysR family transcriptional regulator [Mesorhizobium sp.]|nr:MAG: LysR family transcriptional regulator [Mesorhizobium sp.]TIL87342.1 MAG: LysR family transcriptional regulator [Mesorhizobium sp.]TIL97521.1 MAG: LysR family transcriptional regulator [Mesorhizobium sp.]TIM31992.1 MAG: LysR family transcriptional regulator [Mesorhizobium sp.]TIM69633.1 MAG: LysR family transcriptional regulator [Mesorhizobium sp.]